MSAATRSQREATVTRLLESPTSALRDLPGRGTPRDHARVVVHRYCRAIGVPPTTGGEHLVEYLCSFRPYLLRIKDIDAIIMEFAQPEVDLHPYAAAAADAARAIETERRK